MAAHFANRVLVNISMFTFVLDSPALMQVQSLRQMGLLVPYLPRYHGYPAG